VDYRSEKVIEGGGTMTCKTCNTVLAIGDGKVCAKCADYDKADYYDCCDSEEFAHETPEEALTYYFDNVAVDPKATGAQCEAEIRKHSPVEMRAFKRCVMTDIWIADVAAELAERFSETWEEEYGNPDDEIVSDKEREELTTALAPILRLFADARMTAWACVQIATRTYTADECVAIMRVENPHWFEERCDCHGKPPQNKCKCSCHALPACLMGDGE
jgi:hypothetical protein